MTGKADGASVRRQTANMKTQVGDTDYSW